ncbi:MAG: MMPL family transporter [Acidobacteriota bacterium]|nr:MMPL family transporter [Acidobacteriota bacterium]
MTTSPRSGKKLGGKQRVLLRIERFSRERYRLVFLVTALAVAASIWLGARLQLESDVLELIPKGNPKVDVFRDAIRDFGSIDYLLVLVEEGGEDVGVDDLEYFADLFAEKLRDREKLIEAVEYRVEIDEKLLELFYRNALLFLPADQIPTLVEKFSDEAIHAQVHDNRDQMASPDPFRGELIRKDPLGLLPFFIDRFMSNRGSLRLDLSDGYYLARDGTALLMFVKPAGASQDLEFDKDLMEFVRRTADETLKETEEDLDKPVAIHARFGGNYPRSLEESEFILEDASRNLTISLIAVCVLYWVCYRRFAALLYSSVPLLVGQALTFALAFFVLGRLNSASSSFTALLMGLGTDFTIVMYARYVEERRNGASLARATELMVGETGLGVFTGAITSAGTFYAMCVSRFRGLWDLGFLIGSGILLCALAILFLLPAMITWNEGVRKRKVESVKKLHLQSFLLEYLIPFSARYRWPVLIVVGLMALGSLYLAVNLKFDDSLDTLKSNRSDALRVQSEISEKFGAELTYMMAIARGKTIDEAVERAVKVEKRLQPFLESGLVGTYDSILTYLPPVSEQKEIIAAIREGSDDAFDIDRIRGTFIQALDDNGFRREPFDEYLDKMASFLSPERPITVRDLEVEGLERLVGRYVIQTEEEARVVTYLFPTDKRYKREAPPGLLDGLSQGDPDIIVTGTNVVGLELRKIFGVDILIAVLTGIGIVFVLLLIDFRSIKLTAVAMAQLIAGVLMMLGLMNLLGIQINYVNSFVATMILGVGIDYSIHLVHRLNLTEGRIEPGLLETGKAVVIAALLNMAGFGTLAFGNYPALRSFGLVALLGSVTCLFTALTVVPALMVVKEVGDEGR